MHTPTLWQKVLLSLRFNESAGHNIFLIIVLVIALGALVSIAAVVLGFPTRGGGAEAGAKRRPKPLKVLLGLVAMVFPLGIFLLVDVDLEDLSNASALHEAFLFEVGGDPAAFTVLEKFFAEQTGDFGVSGTDVFMIEAISLKDGRMLYRRNLDVPADGATGVKLLCASELNFFIFVGGRIIVIEKGTGRIVRTIQAADPSGGARLLADARDCAYDRAVGSIIFMASDGVVYGLDPQSLEISMRNPLDAELYFEQRAQEDFDKDLGVGATIARAPRGGGYRMFLAEKDIEALRAGVTPSASGRDAARRFLYEGRLEEPSSLKRISPEPFLSGGFFCEKAASAGFRDGSPGDSPKGGAAYAAIASRGEVEGVKPLEIEGSPLALIVHRRSIEGGASILLSAIDSRDGKTVWTLDTGARGIHQCYRVGRDRIALFCQSGGSMGESLDTDCLLIVSVGDGSWIGYDFSYDYASAGIAESGPAAASGGPAVR